MATQEFRIGYGIPYEVKGMVKGKTVVTTRERCPGVTDFMARWEAGKITDPSPEDLKARDLRNLENMNQIRINNRRPIPISELTEQVRPLLENGSWTVQEELIVPSPNGHKIS